MNMRILVKSRGGLTTMITLACLLLGGGAAAVIAWVRASASRTPVVATTPSQEHPTVSEVPGIVNQTRAAPGSEVGRVEVPSLNMSWTVFEGTNDQTLDRGIGHVEGSANLGESGNIGIAGHRHTHFRKLEWIRRGDEIVLTSTKGTFHYRVNFVKLHKPTDVEVLDPAFGPSVTLITCFPFEYVGSAPLRFIVRAVADKDSLARLMAPHAGQGSVSAH